MSSACPGRRNINVSAFAPPGGDSAPTKPRSDDIDDVHMRSALSDDEEPSRPRDTSNTAKGPSLFNQPSRRPIVNPDAFVHKDGQPLTTYTPSSSQTATGGTADDQDLSTPALPQPKNLQADTSSPALSSFNQDDLEKLPPITSVDLQHANLQSLDAVLVSSTFIKYHIRDLLWMKNRLIEHQAHVLWCRNLTMRNLMAIERALYIESKKTDMEGALGYHRQRESE